MQAVRGGKLRQVLSIEPVTTPSDKYGAVSESFGTAFPARAELVSDSTRESDRAGRQEFAATVVFRVRYDSRITNKSRVTWGTRIFSVDGVETVDGINHETLLTCEERR